MWLFIFVLFVWFCIDLHHINEDIRRRKQAEEKLLYPRGRRTPEQRRQASERAKAAWVKRRAKTKEPQ